MIEVKDIFYILWGLGLVTMLSSIFFVKPGVPVASFNPRNWKPIWKQKDDFKGPGYALAVVGMIWMTIGALVWIPIMLFTGI